MPFTSQGDNDSARSRSGGDTERDTCELNDGEAGSGQREETLAIFVGGEETAMEAIKKRRRGKAGAVPQVVGERPGQMVFGPTPAVAVLDEVLENELPPESFSPLLSISMEPLK